MDQPFTRSSLAAQARLDGDGGAGIPCGGAGKGMSLSASGLVLIIRAGRGELCQIADHLAGVAGIAGDGMAGARSATSAARSVEGGRCAARRL